ncbi:uncharacterized protein cep295 isoform X3 [Cyprinodon tularosa]|uniref:uncharacterized protein cep295 isoform X3 n=1 Tax=Cyprinodon tularosa TaxID=77115 RepID=UPI0018E1EC5B|nr:uncharacterized protein cep295 isoform X3 [Cyprinodon tularosa]
MKRKVSRLRLSPNEEARIIREELERRRKLRIQQVREQQRQIALQIRREVEQRRQHELRQLEEQLREDWERRQREKLQTLQSLYEESLKLLGQSHRSARENEPDPAAVARQAEENHAKAEERYREALKELKFHKIKEQQRQQQSINARRNALQIEKERSAKVASLPPPPPNPIQQIDAKKPQLVKRSDLNVFAATRYHMPETAVEKEPEAVQPDARQEAELEARRLQDLQREDKRRREEQLEKARLRGMEALRREKLAQDRERLLVELEHMQQTDLLRRRQQAAQMPPQIFQPLNQRREIREDFQREMEFAFEDMYTGERRVKGDLVVQLLPEPLPASSPSSQDQDLDVTLDENVEPQAENIQNDSEGGVRSSEQETSAEVEAEKPPPRRALRKLLDRIRSQRNDWINSNSHSSAEDSPSCFTDLIPEKDTTIESGSLSNEPDRRTPVQLCEPTIHTPAVERAEPPPSAGNSPPDVFLIQLKQAEEERKKREAELESEKQQQLVLLQELEEQKSKLEQMLQEAQQEREQLKAAATQEALHLRPQGPDPDQNPTREAGFPAAEDESTRRVREYQRRLLDQNRIHQRSVEVARQRLEEYQRALRIRHNMTAALLRPPVHPAGLVHQEPEHFSALHVPFTPPSEDPKTSVDLSAPPPASRGSVGSTTTPPSTEGADVTAQLTHSILERVTKHLPERLRPSSDPTELSAHRSTSGLTQTTGSRITDGLSLEPRRQVLSSSEEDLDWRRRELEEKLHEEEMRRAEVELGHMRTQKETLQNLIDEDESVSAAASEGLEPENLRQRRLELLASLLRAMEESNGGTLSHLEEPEDGRHAQSESGVRVVLGVLPAEPSGFIHPPRTERPPVTRVRLGSKVLPSQHELSAIQEVETPVNTSRVPDPEDDSPSHPADFNGSGSEAASNRTLQSPSFSSSGPGSAEKRVGSSHLPWGERLLSGPGTSPECFDSVMKATSPFGSDSGRGADFSGLEVLSSRSSSESAGRPAGSACLSSTTISSGSYVSTDPEPNVKAGRPQPISGPAPGDVSSPCSQTPKMKENSAPSPPGLSVDSVFNESCIQRIIDRYTRELNISLGAAGTADSEGAALEESSSSVAQQASVGSSGMRMEEEEENSARGQGGPVDAAAAPSHFQTTTPGLPTLQPFSPDDSSLNADPDQNSFRPLRVHMADQSSCLASEERHSVLEQLVGQPSAHSSMIGPRPGPPSDPSAWDSTLNRMIGRLTQQSGSHWLSPGQDVCAGHQSSEPLWLDEFQESPMRALVRELDYSADPHTGSSAESSSEDHGVSSESRETSQTAPPEAQSHSVPNASHQLEELQNGPDFIELDSHRAEDSFHPLLPEITHNETADPSMTFQLPQHNVSDTSDRSPAAEGPGGSTSSVQGDPCPEQLRTEEPNYCRELQESFSQLVLSECLPQESIRTMSPNPRTGYSVPSNISTLEAGASKEHKDSVPVVDHQSEMKADPDEKHKHFSASEATSEVGWERGILEQSQITLVSLTDTTLQDQDFIATDDEEVPESMKDDGQEGLVTKGADCSRLSEDDVQKLPATILEFQWSPSSVQEDAFQQKRQALIQRSNRRLEEIKSRRSVGKYELKGKDSVKADRVQSVSCEVKTMQTNGEVEGRRAGRKLHLPAEESRSSSKVPVEVKISSPEQRKRNLSEMQKRTRRLYEQLEEVKQQRAVRSRQEDSAKNRLKAKEFHRRTLQKLRAKQTRRL